MKSSKKQQAAIAELRGYYSRLPSDLKIEHSLRLSYLPINTLPDNLHVGATLDLEYTDITQLPDNLFVGNCLFLKGSRITQLPDSLYVGQGVYVDSNVKSSAYWIVSGEIGSRKQVTCYSIKHDKMTCGCFNGSLEAFEMQVRLTYPPGHKHRIEYDAFIEEIKTKLKTHAAIQ
jgi:hypothetical protein